MFTEIGLTDNVDIVFNVLNFATLKCAFNLYCADKSISRILYSSLQIIIKNTFDSEPTFIIDYGPQHFIIDLIKLNNMNVALYTYNILLKIDTPILYTGECIVDNESRDRNCDEYNYYVENSNDYRYEYQDEYFCDDSNFDFSDGNYDFSDNDTNYYDDNFERYDNKRENSENSEEEEEVIFNSDERDEEIRRLKQSRLCTSIMRLVINENLVLFPKVYRLLSLESQNDGFQWRLFEDELKLYVEKYGLTDCTFILQHSVNNKIISLLEIFTINQDVDKYNEHPDIVSLIKEGVQLIKEDYRVDRFGYGYKEYGSCSPRGQFIKNKFYIFDIETELPPRQEKKMTTEDYLAYSKQKIILDQELDEYMKFVRGVSEFDHAFNETFGTIYDNYYFGY